MTARVKGKVRRGEKLSPLASVLSVEQEMKSFMKKEVNRGKEGRTFFLRERLKQLLWEMKKENWLWDKAKDWSDILPG